MYLNLIIIKKNNNIDIKKNDIKKNLGYLALLIGLLHNKVISQYFTDCHINAFPLI